MAWILTVNLFKQQNTKGNGDDHVQHHADTNVPTYYITCEETLSGLQSHRFCSHIPVRAGLRIYFPLRKGDLPLVRHEYCESLLYVTGISRSSCPLDWIRVQLHWPTYHVTCIFLSHPFVYSESTSVSWKSLRFVSCLYKLRLLIHKDAEKIQANKTAMMTRPWETLPFSNFTPILGCLI